MAIRVRYKCPKCYSTVELNDRDGNLVAEKSVPCPKLGCNAQAILEYQLR